MELSFVRWLHEWVGQHSRVLTGVGDDAAIVRIAPAENVVVTVDSLSDGVDFVLSEIDPRLVGRKALAVNLSDLAAMAARPICAVVALTLPRARAGSNDAEDDAALGLAKQIYEGILGLAAEFDIAIAGGDTNMHNGPLVISITAIGEPLPEGPLRRDGAKAGDRLLITGRLGGSISGHHLHFTPRVREAILLHRNYRLSAGIDISDGLALDALRLAEASGCGAIIDVASVPISDAARELAQRDAAESHDEEALLSAALGHALGDGEDFELLLAVEPEEARRLLVDQPLECGLTDLGEVTSISGLRRRSANGKVAVLAATGFVHS